MTDDCTTRKDKLSTFLLFLETDFEALQCAYERDYFDDWREWMKKIRKSCTNMHAEDMAAICEQAQNATDIETINRLHKQAKEHYEKLHQALLQELDL